MTCIAVFRGQYSTTIGADSQWTCGTLKGSALGVKMWENQGWVIGASGSIRAMQVLQYGTQFDPAVKSMNMLGHLVREWVPVVSNALKEAGAIEIKDDNTIDTGMDVLVASRSQIFMFGSDLTVVPLSRHFAACGSGGAFAMGYMAGYSRRCPEGSNVVVRRALVVASKFTAGVGGPFEIKELQ